MKDLNTYSSQREKKKPKTKADAVENEILVFRFMNFILYVIFY